jgi:putative addiction module component (TIGR02574 family)
MGNALPLPPPGFDELDIDEQIEYVQALWDRIAAKEDRVPIPDWHRKILDERLADLQANPNASRPWEEVRAELLKGTLSKEWSTLLWGTLPMRTSRKPNRGMHATINDVGFGLWRILLERSNGSALFRINFR